jgi:transcriptional regulator GlxA family with amidase domain
MVMIMMRVGMIVVPGFDVMSFAPLSVFDAANITLGEQRYEVRVLSRQVGALATHSEWKLSQNRLVAPNLTQ